MSSIPSGVYLNPASAHLRPESTSLISIEELPDHYEILGLDIWATSEEIKASYRQLRGQFFRSEPQKYRKLQAAFDVLANRDSRLAYDKVYRVAKSLPEPAPHQGKTIGQVERLVAKMNLASPSPPPPPRVEGSGPVEEMQIAVAKEAEEKVDVDPNAALKNFKLLYKPLIGTLPYHSLVPIATSYDGGNSPKCGRPKYVFAAAMNSLP
ncbi:hypothetical protein EJ04DRAFT_521098 [Polyplosphaeria fusca]|uniref:J domain-containing protein n=1 Tax=Polyplosphaeria fusca TaxID=682080 RepID=A0A9P4R5Y6_9PLEO|nr:hypothetical protein EJ04DRAFT_521098 [Polyplosphaeria fusca]